MSSKVTKPGPYKNTSDFRRHEIRHAAQVLADAMVAHIDDMTRHCANCSQYNHNAEICDRYMAKPPCRVIVVGCPDWEDEIPF